MTKSSPPTSPFIEKVTLKILGEWLVPRWNWVGGFAAALAFYYLLSLIPFLIVTLSILQRSIPMDLTPQIQHIIKNLLPGESHITPDILLDAVRQSTQSGIFTLNFVLAFWTTWSFLRELLRALHFLFSDAPFDSPSWTHHALKSIGLMGIWSATLLLSTLLFLVAPAIEGALDKLWLISSFALWIWKLWRFVVIAVLVFWAITLTYRVAGGDRWPLKNLRRGAFYAALGWIIICQCYTQILPFLWSRSPINGALGSLMATLLWAYACAWTLLLGAASIVKKGHTQDQGP